MKKKYLLVFLLIWLLISVVVFAFAGKAYHETSLFGMLVLSIAGAWSTLLTSFMYLLIKNNC